VTKFGLTIFAGSVTQQAKIQADRPSGASQQMGEISLSAMKNGKIAGSRTPKSLNRLWQNLARLFSPAV